MADIVEVVTVKIPDPYFRLYLAGDKEENIVHFGGIRLRATGDCNLKARFYGLDDVESEVLVDIPVTPLNAREPFRLANFKGQRGVLELITTEINETFKINRVILFVKTLWSGYPG